MQVSPGGRVNALTSWLVGRVASERLMLAGTATSVLAAGGLLALALSHRLGTPALVGFMLIFTCGAGMAGPASMAKAIDAKPEFTGAAFGLFGFSQMVIAAIVTNLATLGQDLMVSAITVMLGASLLSMMCFAAVRRPQHVIAAAASEDG